MDKFNKKEFLNSDLGKGLKHCIKSWDEASNRLLAHDISTDWSQLLSLCNAKWYVYQSVLEHFYGVEYYIQSTDEYFGVATEGEADWLFKVVRGEKKMCLCQGRHEIPEAEDGAIFPNEINPTDLERINAVCEKSLQGVKKLTLYVTGLTVALVSVINYCHANKVDLTLMHFDRNTGGYYPQKVE